MRNPSTVLGCLVVSLVSISPLVLASGEATFQQFCGGCHGVDGGGTPGLAPSLDQPELWHSLGDEASRYLVGVVSNGVSGKLSADAQGYTGMVMPPVAGIDAENLAQVATHVLSDINGIAVDISPDDVEAFRSQRMTHADLKDLRNGAGEGDG